MSRLSEKLSAGARVLTAEIAPPKGSGIKKFLERAQHLGQLFDAVNVTDCQRALVRMSSLAASKILLENGLEPVFQLTCRDRNTIALQSDLMGAGALGIKNLLCLTGDPVKVGDSPKSKSVFELESVGLLHLVQKLQSGRDGEGEKMNLSTKFFVGAVVNPTLKHGRSQLDRMERKIEAGARFFQTQANYDLDDFALFLDEAKKFRSKIIAGVLLLHSREMAYYIHQNIPGIHLPDSVLQRFESLSSAEEELHVGIQIAAETMKHLEPSCEGFHLMSIRVEEHLPTILNSYKELKLAQPI